MPSPSYILLCIVAHISYAFAAHAAHSIRDMPLGRGEKDYYRRFGKIVFGDYASKLAIVTQAKQQKESLAQTENAYEPESSTSATTNDTSLELLRLRDIFLASGNSDMHSCVCDIIKQKKVQEEVVRLRNHLRLTPEALESEFDKVIEHFLLYTAFLPNADETARVNLDAPLASWGVIPMMRARAYQAINNQRAIIDYQKHRTSNQMRDRIGLYKNLTRDERTKLFRAIDKYYEKLQIQLDFAEERLKANCHITPEATLHAITQYAYIKHINASLDHTTEEQEKLAETVKKIDALISDYYNHAENPLEFLPTSLFDTTLPDSLFATTTDTASEKVECDISKIPAKPL